MKRPFVARVVRKFSIPIVVLWVLFAAAVTIFVPKLSLVTEQHSGAMVPLDAPAQQALLHIGEVFHESTSTSLALIVLESKGRDLGEADHKYYDELVRAMDADKDHVQHIMDFWGKPFMATGVQSSDNKAAYVTVRLAGNIGEAKSNDSVAAIRAMVVNSPPPPGLSVYVTGMAPLMADLLGTGSAQMEKIELLTIIIITFLLLIVYRSFFTMLMALGAVLIELAACQGTVSYLVDSHGMGMSTFAQSMISALILGAGTDYGIFLLGRYQEARRKGEDRETAYYSAYNGVLHVILGSGLTIAGACYCLTFARLDYFKTMGPACAVSMTLTVVAALTLGPALLAVGSRFGLFDSKRKVESRYWRRVGTSIVRWPLPILIASVAAVMLGAVFLPTYRVGYNDRVYQPPNTLSNAGFLAADRHFEPGKLNSEMLMIEADHDLRNSADFITLDRMAKELIRIPGVAEVQDITRPEGRPMEHASIPYLFTGQGGGQGQQLPFTESQIDMQDKLLDVMRRMQMSMQGMVGDMEHMAQITHAMVGDMQGLVAAMDQMNVDAGYLDDFMRPMRNYFYWEAYCYDLPWCWAGRSVFDMLDSIDRMVGQMKAMVGSMEELDKIMPVMVGEMKSMLAMMTNMINLQATSHGTSKLSASQTRDSVDDTLDIGRDFDKSRNDDFFYLPKYAFDNPDFQTGLTMMVSPDGKDSRFFITHEGEAMSPEGLEHVEKIIAVAREALKGTSLAGSKIYLGGSASAFLDIKHYAAADLEIAAIAAFALIFLIMLVITRSLVAALVIIATVAFSFAGAFGLSVLVWQHLIGLPIHWMILPISFIVLVAVGSDYNLLLTARLKEELPGGLKTGLIRSVAGTGGVVTSAGLVFAFTMLAMMPNSMRVVSQLGSTICFGLLLDTLIVRSFVLPSVAAILGKWFWWPQNVRSRPVK